MKEWRPKEWDVEGIKKAVPVWCDKNGKPLYPTYDNALIEAGADAVLGALKNKDDSEYWNAEWEEICLKPLRNGWVVFIPEEE